jgi:type I restriction enzyme R subunit
MKSVTETNIEAFAIETLQSLGWKHAHGLAIAPGSESAERDTFEQILLSHRLRRAIARLNPEIPENAVDQALQKVQRI